MTVYDLFIDFALASILILIGQILRTKVRFFQRFFIPASMLAGFIGLALGPNLLNVLPFSGSISSYAGVLIIIVFTIVGINGFELDKGGKKAKDEANRILGYQLLKIIANYMQFIIPISVTLLFLRKIYPDLNPGFGVLLASGFTGGHGTAAAVGETLGDLGWLEATDLAMTFATIGILLGVFGGILLIKIATKKGETNYIQDFQYVSGDIRTGLVPKENRQSIGDDTISPVSLDTLCFHLSMVLGIGGIGYLLNKWIAKNIISGVPNFTVAYLIALAFFFTFRNTKVYDYIDKGINRKMSGTATDYLVFFGIASIKLTVIIDYAGPLAIMSLVGLAIVLFTVYPLGYGFNKDSWFERSIFVYGYSTGVLAIGFVLLRIVDPENKSKTISDTAMTPFTNIFEVFTWSLVPGLLVSGRGWVPVIVLGLIVLVTLIIAKITKTWHFNTPKEERKALGVNN